MSKLKVTNDYVFKRIFGKQGNESILKDFLIAVLELPIKEIEIIKDASLERAVAENKSGILDLKATLDNKITVNIEMQVRNQHNMIDRSLYYWSNLYSGSLYKKQDYTQSNRTITINILMFNIFEEGPYHEKCMIRRDYNGEILTEDLEMHFIQIPKCKKEDVKTKLDRWIQFIGNISEEGVNIAMKENEEIRKAKEELEYLTGDEEERRLAELREKAIRDEVTNINHAKKEGIAQGLKQGEKNKSIEIAKKMKNKQIDIETIIEMTELTKEEIEKL